MITLVGSETLKVNDAVIRVAKWAVGSKSRLRFLARIVQICWSKEQYEVTWKRFAELFDVSGDVSQVKPDLDSLYSWPQGSLDQIRGDILECVLDYLGPSEMSDCEVSRRFRCKVKRQSRYLGGSNHTMDIGYLTQSHRKLELYECKVDLDRYLSYDSDRDPPLRPTSAVNKLRYMSTLRSEASECGYDTLVAFVTVTGNLDRAKQKVRAYPTNQIEVFGLDHLLARL